MNCKQAQRDIALVVGQDLDDRRQRDEVKRHVTTCPDCREHYRQMKGALKALAQADEPQTYTTTGSLWPELASRINDRQTHGPRGRFNGWAPFVAMTAACLVLAVAVNEPNSSSHSIGPSTARGPSFTTPVAHELIPLFQDPIPPAALSPRVVPFDQRHAIDDARNLDETDDRFVD